MIDNITLVIFVMSNVGLVVSVEFDSSGNDWKLDELALYKAFSQKNGHIWWPSNNSHHHRFCAMLRNANGRQFNFPGYQSPLVELDGWLQKVVLLDLYELWRLRVEYMPQLQMYEEQSTQCVIGFWLSLFRKQTRKGMKNWNCCKTSHACWGKAVHFMKLWSSTDRDLIAVPTVNESMLFEGHLPQQWCPHQGGSYTEVFNP